MKDSREIVAIATVSAKAARKLYFDPLRRLRPFRSLFRREGDDLSTLGRLLLGAGTVALISAMIWAQALSLDAARRSRERVNELLDTLFAQTAVSAMTTPKGPAQEPTAPISDSVRILEPSNNSTVSSRQFIRGTVSDPSSSVWVVVHPFGTSSYWVQPKVDVQKNGNWSTGVYLGRPGSIDSGKQFEMRAILDPRINLLDGQVLATWPDAKAASDSVVVRRE
jgi:hypothetical protein